MSIVTPLPETLTYSLLPTDCLLLTFMALDYKFNLAKDNTSREEAENPKQSKLHKNL